MTTVAFKDGVFMSDTGSTNNNRFDGHVKKLYKTKHWTLGYAGDMFIINRVLEAFEDNAVKPLEKELSTQAYTILAFNHASQKLFIFNERLDSLEIIDPFFAIGSGGTLAMVAMEAGASLRDAVKIAIKYDPFSYDPIREVKVKKP